MKTFKLLAVLFFLGISRIAMASPPDEGMWLPLLIKDYNYEEMKRLGCKLTPEQIYSVNNSSIKDAIVQLGGFCTAEVISDKGLILTNHHCGYDAIAELSSEESNYLKNGFWAKDHSGELPAVGLTVSFLDRMEDVTDRIMKKVNGVSEDQQAMAREEVIAEIEAEYAIENGRVTVKSMFNANAYYVFVYKVFKDIRLVGTPPEAIGKFGGDTDNWMWPRHTGDFSMFRIYADANNEPADYSQSNVPYKPKHSLPVNIQGLEDGDFTMIMGYPGSTSRYLTSYELADQQNNEAPVYVKALEKRLELMKAEMDKSEQVNIDYASSRASMANTWKYFKGQLRGLKKFDLLSQKKIYEKELQKWIDEDADRKAKYGSLLADFEALYSDPSLSNDMAYFNMAAFGPEFVSNGFGFWRLNRMMEGGSDEEDVKAFADELLEEGKESMTTYNALMDRNILKAMLDMLETSLSENTKLDFFESDYYKKKAKGSNDRFADLVMKKSILTDYMRMKKFLTKPNAKKLAKDPGFIYINSVVQSFISGLSGSSRTRDTQVQELRTLYMQALMEKEKSKAFYPNANFTMRLTYGTVKNYDSWEGKPFETFTWASQILDKYKAGDEEFDVPEKLRTLIKNKDYGQYGKEGKLPVCFLHNTDITGGNSGSPVINGNGELIGCAFDGNWESMTSDLFWQDDYVRTISVDIRYVLFIIDKFADASHLIDEMKLVK